MPLRPITPDSNCYRRQALGLYDVISVGCNRREYDQSNGQ